MTSLRRFIQLKKVTRAGSNSCGLTTVVAVAVAVVVVVVVVVPSKRLLRPHNYSFQLFHLIIAAGMGRIFWLVHRQYGVLLIRNSVISLNNSET